MTYDFDTDPGLPPGVTQQMCDGERPRCQYCGRAIAFDEGRFCSTDCADCAAEQEQRDQERWDGLS